MQKPRTDRVLVMTAFVLLVAVVAYLSWDIDRRLDEVKRLQCQSTWAADEITAVSLLKSVEDAPQDEKDRILDVLVATTHATEDVCGPRIDILEEFGPNSDYVPLSER
jgi:Tfp pilus assembly protein PilN